MAPSLPKRRFLALAFIASLIVLFFESTSLVFPKLNLGFLVPFSLAPLFWVVEKYSFAKEDINFKRFLWRSSLVFWLFGYAFQLVTMLWLVKTAVYFTAAPIYAIIFAFLLGCLPTSLYYPILFLPISLYFWLRHKYPGRMKTCFPAALFVTFLEIYFPHFFQWSFGSLLGSNLTLSQLNSLFGFNTGTFFVIYTSLCFTVLDFKNFRSQHNKLFLKKYAIVLICVVAFGQARIRMVRQQFQESPLFRIAYVQPNFTLTDLSNYAIRNEQSHVLDLNYMIDLTQRVVHKAFYADGKKPDLIVWPESSTPDFFALTPWQQNDVTTLVQKTGVPILVQYTDFKEDDLKTMGLRRAPKSSVSVLFTKDGMQPAKFSKWQPMPFGETFPLESVFPNLAEKYRNLFNNALKITPGNSFQSLSIREGIAVAPLICFDALSQKLPYLQAKFGKASFFANQANFGWMNKSLAGFEFARIAQMRAIENGRSLLISSNTGPSMAFNPLGELILPPNKLMSWDYHYTDIPLAKPVTLFQIVYHWPLVILGLWSLLYFIYCYVTAKKKIDPWSSQG